MEWRHILAGVLRVSSMEAAPDPIEVLVRLYFNLYPIVFSNICNLEKAVGEGHVLYPADSGVMVGIDL